MNWRRLWAVMLKEVRQLRRDRITMGTIIGIPVLQLVLFGYAINLNLRGLQAAVADQAGTAGSRALVMVMTATDVIEVSAPARTPQELMTMPRRGEISVGVAIQADFERRRIDGREVVRGGAGTGRRHRHGGAVRGRATGADAAGQQPDQPAQPAADQLRRLLQPGAALGGQHRASGSS